jgi:hypothetical protein
LNQLKKRLLVIDGEFNIRQVIYACLITLGGEDLRYEGAEIISVSTHFCQPRRLTIDEHDLTIRDLALGPLTFFDILAQR